jgi:hypothetical protein
LKRRLPGAESPELSNISRAQGLPEPGDLLNIEDAALGVVVVS